MYDIRPDFSTVFCRNSSRLAEFASQAKQGKMIYASSKLANLLFSRHLSTRRDLIKGVDICLASPGFTFTKLHRYFSRSRLAAASLFAPLFVMILKSPKQGAQTIIGCAMTTSKMRSDVLYYNCKANESIMQQGIINDSSLAEHVFDQTMKSIM